MTRPLRLSSLALLLALPALAAACGSSSVEVGGARSAPDPDMPATAMTHEPCDEASASAEKVDINGDGRPDIIRVGAGGHEACRVLDLNHDGRADAYVYFDAGGQVRRRESDFDRDGRIDEIAHYSGGVVVRKDRETNLDGKLDTWDDYEGGALVRRRRDSDGNGHVDQWWTFGNPARPECAVIASDRDGDGRPEPTETVDLCADQAGAADAGARDAAAKAPDSTDAAAKPPESSDAAAKAPESVDAAAKAPESVDAGAASAGDAGVREAGSEKGSQ